MSGCGRWGRRWVDGWARLMLGLRGAAGNELMVVPVPLFAAKERGRGYNQSDVLAAAAVGALRASAPEWRLEYVPGLLERRRATETRPA